MVQVLERTSLDSRVWIRSNVFLIASMAANGKSTLVRVRNISERGALLDGPDLPPEGAPILLRRGGLSATGNVAWQTESQCGIRFTTSVDVAAWVRRVGQPGQERVDRLVQVVRGNAFPSFASTIEKRVDDSLERILADLVETCERLADLPFSVEQSEEFLRIDALSQRLAKITGSPTNRARL